MADPPQQPGEPLPDAPAPADPPGEPDQPDQPDPPDEPEEPGVWDVAFARSAAWALGGTAMLLTLVTAIVFNRVARYQTALRSNEQWVDGSFADRASFTLALLGIWVGTLLLLVAAFLAAVEVRSRLVALADIQATSGSGDFGTASAGPVKETVAAIAEALTKARGTAVVAIAGAAIVVVALFQAGSISDGPPEAPADGASTTAEP